MEQYKYFHSHAVPLEGILNLPDQVQAPYPLVMLCHGHSRNKNDGLDKLAQLLAENGIASFRIDFRACSGVYGRFNLLPRLEWTEDLYSAITFITHEEGIDATRIGISGISMGGALTVYAAATDRRIKCAATMAAVANCKRTFYHAWKKFLGEEGFGEMLDLLEADRIKRVRTGISDLISSCRMTGIVGDDELEYLYDNCREQVQGRVNNNYVTLESVDDTMKFVAEDFAPQITVPLLVTHGLGDVVVPVSEAESIYEKARSEHKELMLVEDCEHNMPIDPKADIVFEKIVQWFVQYL